MERMTMLVFAISVTLTGCAHIEFGDPPSGKGLIYFEPQPYLLVQQDDDCVATASSVVLPGNMKQMLFKTGYGSGSLSASLANGMIASVGQDSASGANEAITAVAALAAVVAVKPDEASTARAGSKKKPTGKPCPNAMLYPIENGAPQMTKGFQIVPPPPPENR